MNNSVILIGSISIVILISVVLLLLQRAELTRNFREMNELLDAAMKGEIQEKGFNESQLSKLSIKLKRFLVSSQLSRQNIEKEKENIKTLISDISHQTKTPITNIMLYLQLLKEQEHLTPEISDSLELIQKQSEKLDFLLQALVKTSRLETGIITLKPAYGSLNPVVLSAIEEAYKKATLKSIQIRYDFKEDFFGFFDQKWTTEAIYNILDNAAKYTNVGGSIEINITNYELFVRIDIKDTGMGVSVEEQNQIFQRFYRGRNATKQEGIGIGLYLSRQILMEEGGYIKLLSKPGKGSTFSVFISKTPKTTQTSKPL